MQGPLCNGGDLCGSPLLNPENWEYEVLNGCTNSSSSLPHCLTTYYVLYVPSLLFSSLITLKTNRASIVKMPSTGEIQHD